MSEQKQNKWTSISPLMAKKWMDTVSDAVVVDVRTEEEFTDRHIPGAVNIVNEKITDRPEELPDLGALLLIYCRTGRRSKEAAQKLADLGYYHVYEFGGVNTWPYELVEEATDSLMDF